MDEAGDSSTFFFSLSTGQTFHRRMVSSAATEATVEESGEVARRSTLGEEGVEEVAAGRWRRRRRGRWRK